MKNKLIFTVFIVAMSAFLASIVLVILPWPDVARTMVLEICGIAASVLWIAFVGPRPGIADGVASMFGCWLFAALAGAVQMPLLAIASGICGGIAMSTFCPPFFSSEKSNLT